MRINSKTFRQWLLTNFTRQELKEIATHGADTGWNGLCYYSETTKLFERFKYELCELYYEYVEETGEHLKGYLEAPCYEQLANFFVWFAAEWIASQLTERD